MNTSDVRRVMQAVHNHLTALESTARLGSFRAAADELSVSQGAIAQQVRAMESKLGMELFTRLPRGLAVNEGAQEYVARVRLALGIIEEATRDLIHQERSKDPNQLTLSTTASFASRWLIPRLAGFASAHPEIAVMIDASEVVRPMHGRGCVDMSIRWGAPPFNEGHASFLFPGRAIPVCSPELAGYGTWQGPDDLARAPLINDSHNNWKRWFEVYGDAGTRFTGPVFSQTSLALDAAEQGMGIALIPEPLVASSLKNGLLVKAIGNQFRLDTEYGFYVVTADPVTPGSIIDLVVAWLVEEANRV